MRTVLDLFCGAGGLSYSFEMAGFKIVGAIDFDPISATTYRLQHPNVPFLLSDIAQVSAKKIRSLLPEQVDVVVGGPSCQGFSTHGKRDPNDARNFLFKHFIRVVGDLQPSWVVMENVKGLLTYDGGRYRDEIHRSFERIGYRIDSRVLLAADYGVPQLRERLFFLATNTGAPISFPIPTHCRPDQLTSGAMQPYVTVLEAIGDLPELGPEGESSEYANPPRTAFQKYARRGGPKTLTLHRAKRISELAMGIVTKIPQGCGIRAIPQDRLPERFRRMRRISTGALRRDCTTLYYRLSWDRPSYTITCYFGNVSSGPFVHPTQNRALTPREAARLQSFPDSYLFFDSAIHRQIGNAVPPVLARAVGREIMRQIEREPEIATDALASAG